MNFTEKERTLLKDALQWAYNQKLVYLGANRVIMSSAEIKATLKQADEIDDLNTKI
jgi:hypothetical protein